MHDVAMPQKPCTLFGNKRVYYSIIALAMNIWEKQNHYHPFPFAWISPDFIKYKRKRLCVWHSTPSENQDYRSFDVHFRWYN